MVASSKQMGILLLPLNTASTLRKTTSTFLLDFGKLHSPLTLNSTVFRAVVTGTLMSGIEPEVLNKIQLEEIESNHMALMRKATGSLSSYDSNGIRKQHSNTFIRELMGINHTTREISKRRIKWYKEILTKNEDNK